MKKRSSYKEEQITEILASTGFIFPRNEVDLENFEILYEKENFDLTGQEIDPDVILNRNKSESKIITLSEVRNYMDDDLKLIARKDDDSFQEEIEKYFRKPNTKKNTDSE